jgi:hypothetical protein
MDLENNEQRKAKSKSLPYFPEIETRDRSYKPQKWNYGSCHAHTLGTCLTYLRDFLDTAGSNINSKINNSSSSYDMRKITNY